VLVGCGHEDGAPVRPGAGGWASVYRAALSLLCSEGGVGLAGEEVCSLGSGANRVLQGQLTSQTAP